MVEENEEEKQPIDIEKGKVTESQMKEIEAGDFLTVKEIAGRLSYSKAWITVLVQQGRIKGVKPLGGQWRVPRSEFRRLMSEGLPPPPRVTAKTEVEEIEIPPEKVEKIERKKKKEEKEEGSGASLFSWFLH